MSSIRNSEWPGARKDERKGKASWLTCKAAASSTKICRATRQTTAASTACWPSDVRQNFRHLSSVDIALRANNPMLPLSVGSPVWGSPKCSFAADVTDIMLNDKSFSTCLKVTALSGMQAALIWYTAVQDTYSALPHCHTKQKQVPTVGAELEGFECETESRTLLLMLDALHCFVARLEERYAQTDPVTCISNSHEAWSMVSAI